MIGSRLSAILEEKKISQSAFARMMGVDRMRVNTWVKNKTNPGYETIKKISEILGVSTDNLLGSSVGTAPGWVKIPLLGEVPAGNPIEASEEIRGFFSITTDLKKQIDFGLLVRGESMTGAGIFDGDYVFVKHQPTAESRQIVVARLDGEVTIKRFLRVDHSVILKPENSNFDPIFVDSTRDFSIIGVVNGLWRGGIK